MKKRTCVVLVLAIFAVASVFAFQFSPLEQTFAPTGADSAKSYTIVNDSDDTIAVMITALTRDQDKDGVEVNKDASRYFSISPAKTMVAPHSTQVVRVQYRGPSTTTRELSFRLRAEQIQYSQGRQEQTQNMFNFLYIYTTSLYVQPTKTVENVSIKSVAPFVDKDGNKQMKVELTNSGTVHQILIGAELTVIDGAGNRVIIAGNEELPGIDGINILANKTLTKYIPWPEALAFPADLGGTYQAMISYSR